jgi:hypothetical protein
MRPPVAAAVSGRDDVGTHPVRSGLGSNYRAIGNLIATYAELVDEGDCADIGILLADAPLVATTGSVRGRHAIEQLLRDHVIVYDDGTP